MTGTMTVLWKEWRSFLGSDRGVFVVYGVLILTWSYLFSSSEASPVRMGPVWMVFFSVIVAANFASTVFVAERTNGALEILLTSGLSRDAVLAGKMLFVVLMTLAIGFLCIALSFVWGAVIPLGESASAGSRFGIGDALLFASSALLNAASSAFFSVRLGNPRVLHFINLLMLAGIVSVYYTAAQFFTIGEGTLAMVLLGLAIVFTVLSRREFQGEKIIQTVVL